MDNYFDVDYSPQAVEDILSIYDYIDVKLKAKQNAISQTKRIREKVRSLEFMPEKYKRVEWEPWYSMGMRSVSVDNFTIFYLVDDESKRVTVVRIFYSGRNIENIIRNISLD